MQINKHGSFYLRNGWPTKILDAVRNDAHIYSPNNELLAVDTIGVGRVMIKAMRYWATVLGLTEESKDQLGVIQVLTPLGQLIAEHDLFCTDKGTLWLLHRNISCSEDDATAWYWAFNIYPEFSFQKESFADALHSFLQLEGASYSKTAVSKEFDCFKNTYVSDQAFSLTKIIDEDTVPFFAPLKLLEYKGKGRFEKRRIPAQEIPDDIFMYCLLVDNQEHLRENRQLSINTLLEGDKQVGRYMNLSFSAMLELLQKLENKGYLKLVNSFGNRYVEMLEFDEKELIVDHYLKIGR